MVRHIVLVRHGQYDEKGTLVLPPSGWLAIGVIELWHKSVV